MSHPVIQQPRGGLARARETAIAAAILAKWEVPWREFHILVAAWAAADDREKRLSLLMLEHAAPSRKCADFGYMIACSSPNGISDLVRERLAGFLPDDVIEDIAEVAGPLAFGATVKIKPLAGAHRAH